MSRTFHQLGLLRSRGGAAIRRAAGAVVDLILPPACAICGELLEHRPADALACQACRDQLLAGADHRCCRCDAPVPPPWPRDKHCVHCGGDRYAFQRVISLGVYESALEDAVRRAKSSGGRGVARSLGDLLAEQVASRWSTARFDVVAPVPAPWPRRVNRGHNSPDAIAEAIAHPLGGLLASDALRYRRRTRQQHLLTPRERRRNMRGAFQASPRYRWKGLRVLIVDDVLTTGGTADAAARALAKAGAGDIHVAVAARGIGRR